MSISVAEGRRLLSSLMGPSYKMLIVGETGSGKTSFVNLLCNCATVQALGLKCDTKELAEFRKFNDMKLERAESLQMESKTSGTKAYDIQLSELKVKLIDTPGFGDSRGMKEDEKNVKKIIAALKEEDYVNCVCLIINGRLARMTVTLKYVMTEITAILPKEILNNIIVVFSNTADPLDLNFEPNVLSKSFGLDTKHIFCIENPYCRLEKAKQKKDMLPIDTIAKSLKKSFDDTAEAINDMYTAMKDFKKVHTKLFTTLYEKKQEIERRVLILVTAYDNQQSLEESLKNTQKEVTAALQTKQLNKDFTCVQRVSRVIVVSTPKHNTLCGVKNCHKNCHLECGLPKSFNKEDFRFCTAMDGKEECSQCGHRFICHYHDEAKFEQVTEKKNFIDEAMRKQFNRAKSQEDRARIIENKLKEELKQTKAEKKRLTDKLLLVMDEFSELGMIRNYAKLIENQIEVIDTRIKGSVGSENADLQKAKQTLKEKFVVVTEAMGSEN